jgi:enoyl-CoA hydratase/carnithine racemase
MALVQKSAEASVGTITLDHQEKHNALSAELISDLLRHWLASSIRGLA